MIHIRALAEDMHHFGHHSEQFGPSAAGQGVREAKLSDEDTAELMRCCGLVARKEPMTQNPCVHEVVNHQGMYVGIVFKTRGVLQFPTGSKRAPECSRSGRDVTP